VTWLARTITNAGGFYQPRSRGDAWERGCWFTILLWVTVCPADEMVPDTLFNHYPDSKQLIFICFLYVTALAFSWLCFLFMTGGSCPVGQPLFSIDPA